jgi:hypothetical protein
MLSKSKQVSELHVVQFLSKRMHANTTCVDSELKCCMEETLSLLVVFKSLFFTPSIVDFIF